jgi:predicted dienelactone hydrolase
MLRPGLALAAALSLATPTLSEAAGFRFIDIPADTEGPEIKGAVWSPCAEPPGELSLGPVSIPAVKNCPIVGDKLPLIIISHGRRGWFGGHHDTAETLADAGFIVAAISHPGDNGQDGSRDGEVSVWVERSTDTKRLVDFMLVGWSQKSRVDPERIGFFGFSRGGYTGLVAIGGNPDFKGGLLPRCREGSTVRICEQLRRNELPEQPLTHDPRIKAAVIADPAAFFFAADGLRDVTVPLQLWASANGGSGVELDDVKALDRNLPSPHEFHVVANAGHFAFLTPCWPELAKELPWACLDEPGFDRLAFHQEFNAEVLAFFRKHLLEAGER